MNSFLSHICADNKKILACLAVAALAGYAIILPTPFKTMDDLVSIVNNPRIQQWDRLGEIFTTSFFTEKAYYRPLVLVSFMVEYQLFGLKAFFYNLTNVLLHTLNAFLGFLIAARLLGERRLAFFAGLLYVIHPAHWEAVSNIPGRSIILCSFFFLAGCYLFMRSADGEGGVSGPAGAVVCFVLALLSKESAVMLPFTMAAYCILVKGRFGMREALRFVPYAVVLVLYFILRQALHITSVEPWGSVGETFLGLSTFLGVCLYYTQQILFPVNFYYDHTTALLEGPGDIMLWIAWVVWGAVFTALAVFRKRIPPAVMFAFGWIVLNLATVSQIIPLRSPGGRVSTADHFLYLPLLGALIIVVWAADRWLIRGAALKPLIKQVMVGGYAAFLFLVLLQHNFYASNQIAMFERGLEHDPGNTRVRNSLAVIYGYAGKYDKAEFHYREAVKRDPHNTHALIGLGQALADQGRYAEALEQYRRVRDPRAFRGRHRQNLIYAYEQLIPQLRQRGETAQAAVLERTLDEIRATKN